jgi:LytS/YehU family sensor histidine kinase
MRVLQITLMGTLIWLIFLVAGFQYEGKQGLLITWLQNVFITCITWITLENSIGKLDEYISWRRHPFLRFITQAAAVPILSSFTIGIPMYLVAKIYLGQTELNSEFRTMMVIGILFSFCVSTVFSAMEFYRKSLQTAMEVELLKEAGLRSQLETLRQQVNPHFLFNSLNVLSALIPLDSEKAQTFVRHLSKVYRYVLDAGKSELAEIHEELEFLYAYSYLLQQRFGDALIWEISKDENIRGRIPSLAVQLLAENAVQHNIVSKAKPLTIKVEFGNGVVRIKNNLQLKQKPESSTGIGLYNITQRYVLSGFPEPLIVQTESYFEVVLPIIPS